VENEISHGLLALVECDLNISNGPAGVSYRSFDLLSPAALEFLNELKIQAKTMPHADKL